MRSTTLMLLMSVCISGHLTLAAQKASEQDRPRFKLLHVLSTDYDQNSIAFSPDGKQLLSGGWNRLVGKDFDGTKITYSQDGQLGRWAVSSGKLLKVQPTKLPLMTIAYSPDGQLLATGYGGEVRLSSAATGKTIRRMKIPVVWSDPVGVESLAFSPDGLTLAVGTVVADDHSMTGPFYLWNVSTGKQYGSSYHGFFQPLDRNGGHRDQWFSVASASNMMVSQSKQGLVIRQFRGGKFSKKILPDFNTVPLVISQEGQYLFGLDDSLQVWDLKLHRQVADIGCDAEGSYPQVAISPDMKYVAVSKSHKIFVWQITFPSRKFDR